MYRKLRELGYDPKYTTEARNCISFDDYIMSLACLTALRSCDPNTQVGACIVNEDKRIVALGFNDFPTSYIKKAKDFELPLTRLKDNTESFLNTKYPYMCHAAFNAILNKNSSNLRNCTLYATTLPCNECFKLIAQSRIKNVYYLKQNQIDWTEKMKESIKGSTIISMFCGIELHEYNMNKQIPIEFKKKISDESDHDSSRAKRLKIETQIDPSNFIPKYLKDLGFNPKYDVQKRDVLTPEDYFMSIAVLNSRRSKDPVTQVGACIVDDKGRIVSCGYNGFPNKTEDFSWDKPGEKTINSKHMYVCHAELNAIVNKYDTDVTNCTIYVTLFPCNDCAKLIIQSQIKKVVYLNDDKSHKEEYKASRVLFEKYGVDIIEFKPSKSFIDFEYKSGINDEVTYVSVSDD